MAGTTVAAVVCDFVTPANAGAHLSRIVTHAYAGAYLSRIVTLADAGAYLFRMDSRLRGNDGASYAFHQPGRRQRGRWSADA